MMKATKYASLQQERKNTERLPKNGWQGTDSNGIHAYLANQEAVIIIGLTTTSLEQLDLTQR